jgi:hypothetical protein
MTQAEEHLPNKHKVLSSNRNTTKKNKIKAKKQEKPSNNSFQQKDFPLHFAPH